MTLIARIALVAIAAALSGCWVGAPVFQASDSAQPIPPGVYRLFDSERDFPDVRPVAQANGLTRMDEEHVLGFIPLDDAGRLFAVWAESEAYEPGIVQYLLMERRSDREFLFYSPVCEGRAVRLASQGDGLSEADCDLQSSTEIRAALSGLSPRPENVAATLIAR